MSADQADRAPKNTISNAILSCEMDYSLLASDMQKMLTISVNCKNGHTHTNPHPDKKKLRSRSCAYLEDIDVHKCPLCSGNFSSKDLLAKHALRIHHKAIVALLQDGSTEQHLKCWFCVHKVMHRHQKLLLLHLEKKHAVEFVSYFRQSFLPSTASELTKKEAPRGHEIIANLQEDMEGMSLSHGVSNNLLSKKFDSQTEMLDTFPKLVNFEGTLFPGSENDSSSKNLVNQLSSSSYVKRKLVLDGTINCHAGKVSLLMKENIPPKESLSVTLSRSGWKHVPGRPYACGRCKEAFSCNALLLDHVSARHRGPLRLLKPLYTCGLCSASFYKNSFLVRHCYQHHTPK